MGTAYFTLSLENRTRTEDTIEVEFKFIIKHPHGGEDISECSGRVVKFSTAGSRFVGGVGPYVNISFAIQSSMYNYLVDGTLIVEVHMRTNKPGQQSAPFVPENPFLRNAMMDFGDEETTDVKLEVGEAVLNRAGRRKRGKTSTTTFHAHHLVLRRNAPALADMCQPGNGSAPIKINNVRPEIVKHLLYYCYGGKIDEEDLQSNAKEIIEAADRFDIVNLKLEAEACYVDMVELTLDNIIEIVAYADSKNLALLKEHCMDFLGRADKGEVAEKVSFDDMPHLMQDLLVAMARSEKKSSSGDELSTMRVSELRRLAHEKGLDVDGSRETLIASIKDNEDTEG